MSAASRLYNPAAWAGAVVWRFAFALRETGQALERVGCRLQGIYSYEEVLPRHMPIVPCKYNQPSLGQGAWVAPSALLVGKVAVGQNSSIWYNASVRGDYEPVTIGHHTNIQDGAIVSGQNEYSPPVEIGSYVSVGHGAIIKGAKIGDHSLVGINAVISEGSKVGALSIVAAGSYVEENTVIPSGEVWAGNPAKKLRDLKPQERQYLQDLPTRYTGLAGQHKEIMHLLKLKQEEYSA